ncbi:uncharacterized protein LOC141998064 [Natator depressus]|uniref:uncharacterized protein LOC141998064 n=1 Tax=Natator depressus TaxID=27790 RepID=UPI003EB7418E
MVPIGIATPISISLAQCDEAVAGTSSSGPPPIDLRAHQELRHRVAQNMNLQVEEMVEKFKELIPQESREEFGALVEEGKKAWLSTVYHPGWHSMDTVVTVLPDILGSLNWWLNPKSVVEGASVPTILDYLLSLKQQGLAVSSIRVHLAVISAFHLGENGRLDFSNPMVRRFLKGLECLYPQIRHPVPTWDLNLVLSRLMGAPFEPMATCSLPQLLDSLPSCRLSSSSALAMAGEIVYADLNIPEAFSTSKSLHSSQHPNIPQCPCWHRLALWLGWAGNIILVAAVIALGVWGQTERPRTTNGIGCNSSLKDSKPDNNSTEGCECKLCPAGWLPHKNKCYWVSKESKTWNESRVDCSAKSSQMVMIQDKEEMAYILSISQLNLVWLGLSVTSPERKWTWVDGSTFNETLFQLRGAAERESCVMIKGNRALSETCLALAKWICEKVALK